VVVNLKNKSNEIEQFRIIMRKCCLLFLFFFATFISVCQDAHFSQFYANPLYLNPAFVGNSYCPKINLNFKNQWTRLDGGYSTYSMSYDKFAESLGGGVGVLITHDKSGAGNLSTTNVNLIYGYTLNINRNLSFKGGFQLGYFQNSIDWDNLTFADMYTPIPGITIETNETKISAIGKGIDISAGGIFYNEFFFGGLAVHHLTEPEQYIFGYSDTKLNRKYSIHGGAKINIDNGLGELVISPNLLIQFQGNFSQYNFGCYIDKGPVVIGAWYRWNDGIIGSLGIMHNNFRIGYSFDYSVGKIGFNIPLVSHEISISHKFKCKPKKRRKYRIAQCPEF
jgi:type IX secretion system PorP/SprF family membrane protein